MLVFAWKLAWTGWIMLVATRYGRRGLRRPRALTFSAKRAKTKVRGLLIMLLTQCVTQPKMRFSGPPSLPQESSAVGSSPASRRFHWVHVRRNRPIAQHSSGSANEHCSEAMLRWSSARCQDHAARHWTSSYMTCGTKMHWITCATGAIAHRITPSKRCTWMVFLVVFQRLVRL